MVEEGHFNYEGEGSPGIILSETFLFFGKWGQGPYKEMAFCGWYFEKYLPEFIAHSMIGRQRGRTKITGIAALELMNSGYFEPWGRELRGPAE